MLVGWERRVERASMSIEYACCWSALTGYHYNPSREHILSSMLSIPNESNHDAISRQLTNLVASFLLRLNKAFHLSFLRRYHFQRNPCTRKFPADLSFSLCPIIAYNSSQRMQMQDPEY